VAVFYMCGLSILRFFFFFFFRGSLIKSLINSVWLSNLNHMKDRGGRYARARKDPLCCQVQLTV